MNAYGKRTISNLGNLGNTQRGFVLVFDKYLANSFQRLAFSFLKIINVLFTCPPELNKYNPAIHGGEKSQRKSGFSPKRQQQSG
jgi:hypothetical protein